MKKNEDKKKDIKKITLSWNILSYSKDTNALKNDNQNFYNKKKSQNQ